MTTRLETAQQLQQDLQNFVLEAEGELAVALETYAAEQLRGRSSDAYQQDLVMAAFPSEGWVGDRTPIDLYIAAHPDLTAEARSLLQEWHRSFLGLFVIQAQAADELELMNWLTAKHYKVVVGDAIEAAQRRRLQPGEILLTRLSPLDDARWMLSGPCIFKGKLGKPKLAVVVGEFKDNYRSSLYSDAPDLLEEAWQSVQKYHDEFLDFFQTDEVTLSGYELNKKIQDFQTVSSQKRLAEAGIDQNKSLAEMAEEAGLEDADIEAMSDSLGIGANVIAKTIKNTQASKMVMPKVELPSHLKRAERVTVLADPRWGQQFVLSYGKFADLLKADTKDAEAAQTLALQWLKDPEITAFVWYRLAQQYPEAVEAVLQQALDRPEFKLAELDTLLQEFGKRTTPELPEIASVPIHLHNLFQEAIAELDQPKSKKKAKKAKAKGFQ
ncbi:hypothetical protein [Almyronema epifaneia]|uniref:Uncharacterized protein n=1 Tax=Almyronema epifaneia S1 TaxID=2991925 RepID=A0ABW6IAQ4_9CYAN